MKMKTVWVITRPCEIEGFHMSENCVKDFVKRIEALGQKVDKVTEYKKC